MPGSRSAMYWRADVEAILNKQGKSPERTDENLFAAHTAITALTENGPFYRGQSVMELVESEDLESVAAILWQSDRAATFTDEPIKTPRSFSRLWPKIDHLPITDIAIISVPFIEEADARVHDLSPTGFARTGAEVMRRFGALMVHSHEVTGEPLHKVITRHAPEGRNLEDIVRRLLVLSADHELDPTTYAVRAAANTGVNPYRVMISGLVASNGRRLLYGKYQALSRLLDQISSATSPEDVIVERIREGEALPGFGSPLYGSADPRATSLLSSLNKALDGDPELAKLNAAIGIAREITDQGPDLPLLSLFVSRKLGLRIQSGLASRLGRIAGWMAHAMEQYNESELVRPRSDYTGPLPY
eukprot:TRINITY_DN33568_c0_g1_i1.p1 TRINITY_DN33568_c0_g1~~TRINITY_DN33568_c0_g1_i1.p1  ORF type:complete len:396 (+),score=-12.11 TRINITY_DN33568_c0_g1_i1:110-1189(+)